jgi:hypothetical protein
LGHISSEIRNKLFLEVKFVVVSKEAHQLELRGKIARKLCKEL